jgi:hypothetical protein
MAGFRGDFRFLGKTTIGFLVDVVFFVVTVRGQTIITKFWDSVFRLKRDQVRTVSVPIFLLVYSYEYGSLFVDTSAVLTDRRFSLSTINMKLFANILLLLTFSNVALAIVYYETPPSLFGIAR